MKLTKSRVRRMGLLANCPLTVFNEVSCLISQHLGSWGTQRPVWSDGMAKSMTDTFSASLLLNHI